MVLSILCNDDKVCQKSYLSYFRVMYPKVLLPHLIFISEIPRWNFGKVVVILGIIPTDSSSAERSISVFEDRKQTLEVL